MHVRLMEKINKKIRGFIGPIGDDLPSLIPLVFALIIFFSTLNYALTQFSLTNYELNNRLELLRITKILRSDGLISGFEDWNKICNSVPRTSLKFRAGIVYFPEQDRKFLDTNRLETFFQDEETGNFFVCASKNFDGKRNIEERFKNAASESPETAYSLIYPIALEVKKETGEAVVYPAHLVIVAWK